jgi:hypothetical protein
MTTDELTRVPLDRARFLDLEESSGTTIHCLEGCLWITRDGSLDDTALMPGQTYRLADASRVLVSAFGPSLAQVARPQRQPRPAPLRALARWAARLPLGGAAVS